MKQWDVLLMRVALPRRPGALGALASAVGTIGADISLVEIVDKGATTEIDELILHLPAPQTVESLVRTCDSLEGVEVQWVLNYPRGGGLEHDVQLRRRMVEQARRAPQVLVEAAPLVFRADWGLLVDVSGRLRVTFSTPDAPTLGSADLEVFRPFDLTHRVALADGWSPGWGSHHAVVAPMPPSRVVVIGRRGEPPFFNSELARLNYLAGLAPDVVSPVGDTSASTPSGLQRRPIAPPLYIRSRDGTLSDPASEGTAARREDSLSGD